MNSPQISFKTYHYNKSEQEILRKKTKHKNDLAKFGVLLMVFGFVLQLTSIIFG